MFVKIYYNHIKWTVRKGVELSILDNLFHKLQNYSRFPDFVLVKDNNVRSAFFYRTGNSAFNEVFVKRYKCRGINDVCKHIIFSSKAVSEWRALKRFEKRKLPCPGRLAFSEQRSFRILRDSCLIAESLTGAIPLNEYIEKNRPVALRNKVELIKALAALISRLHRTGVFYRDLHAGNLLIKQEKDSPPGLFFIDLHRAFFLPGLFLWMQIKDLAQLCNSISTSKADKLRFLKEYCKDLSRPEISFTRLRKRIYNKSLKLEKCRIKSRSKRCLKNSSVFEKAGTWDETYYGRKEFGRKTADKALSLHGLIKSDDNDSTIKNSSKSVLTTHSQNEGLPVPVCLKRYRFLGALYAIKNIFRKSRAMKSWVAANSLMVRGLETPVPLAIVEKKWGPFIIESFLITQWLQEAEELNDYISRQLVSTSGHRKKDFIMALARVIRKLHTQGIYHADLKSNNILVTDRENDGWKFYFVDLDRVYLNIKPTFYQRANNLAQINASVSSIMTAKDRLNFFYHYAKGTTFFEDRKKYYRKILEISRTKLTEPYGVSFK
jgi:tRNA A-37 threonylcarbamoyl transferase component Bud32